AWDRIRKDAGIEDIRIHDLRRTLGSYQAATGANGYIIGKSLGHKSQQSTAIYARLNLDPVRESVNKATDAMFGYMGTGNLSDGTDN
ncbi:tyrosine-type recombinase/integrase, partial [Escherichia coli]|nr:tyrosine-type recombinase/integrase [Escherichia coli]